MNQSLPFLEEPLFIASNKLFNPDAKVSSNHHKKNRKEQIQAQLQKTQAAVATTTTTVVATNNSAPLRANPNTAHITSVTYVYRPPPKDLRTEPRPENRQSAREYLVAEASKSNKKKKQKKKKRERQLAAQAAATAKKRRLQEEKQKRETELANQASSTRDGQSMHPPAVAVGTVETPNDHQHTDVVVDSVTDSKQT